ncbi:MAG TPA: NUDIX hydrolase [Caulobacteraceae bacterium]|jgi:hypothetical protein|nr:NUDIX hydrolase [Caulobacteraceae bacterium]
MARPASKDPGSKQSGVKKPARGTKKKSSKKAGANRKTALAFKPRAQYAALPFRTDPQLEVLLVTSRETGRWVIPKGWPIRGKSRRATAEAEARQEAGVIGEIGKSPLGQYDYVKVLKTGLAIPCRVTVFPLRVTGQKERWREQAQRTGRWFDGETAAACVQEPQLAAIIRRFVLDGPPSANPEPQPKA